MAGLLATPAVFYVLLREPRPDDVLNEPRRKRPLSSLEGPAVCRGLGGGWGEGEGDYSGSFHLDRGPAPQQLKGGVRGWWSEAASVSKRPGGDPVSNNDR